ncbi:MAG: FAD-dependent oxidoreductase, partial [Gammaproteobacteria bacterium]|nr:FAD-dependent oxidoreductase [Gammaproteobacteria bacterium]
MAAVNAPAGASAGPYSRAMQRAALDANTDAFDVLVIGGGATGAGIVLDAAVRGYRAALLERDDFGAGTSSASSKLIHGGVRYLAQGRIGLVREALRERAVLRRNAPALVRPLDLIVPTVGLFSRLKYRVGLGIYDLLAGSGAFHGIGRLTPAAVRAAVPNLAEPYCGSAFRYRDGQFDDTALLIATLRSAVDAGAVVV